MGKWRGSERSLPIVTIEIFISNTSSATLYIDFKGTIIFSYQNKKIFYFTGNLKYDILLTHI